MQAIVDFIHKHMMTFEHYDGGVTISMSYLMCTLLILFVVFFCKTKFARKRT